MRQLLLNLFTFGIAVQSAFGGGGTYCNPLDLDYKYNIVEKWRKIA